METKPVINLRGTNCLPEVEETFNTWYDDTHIPMLLKSGEISEVTRYGRIGDDEKFPKYLVIYQFENLAAFERFEASPEGAAAIKEVKSTWPAGGYESKWRVQYEATRTWKK